MSKIRIDRLIVEKGLTNSRERAQALIMAGSVLVNEIPAKKPGQLVDPESKIRITGVDHPYVGRGGVKLAHALKEFKIDVAEKICIDVGASTGGFTDCLLQNGATKVYAIDVGYNQLDWKLRSDPRVVVMERTNIRELVPLGSHPEAVGPKDLQNTSKDGGFFALDRLGLRMTRIDLIVVDVSFISLEKVFPHMDRLIEKGGTIIALIKPQFEVGRENIAKGGIVRDEGAREGAIVKVCRAAEDIGWTKKGITISPITGADGNVEFLAWFVK